MHIDVDRFPVASGLGATPWVGAERQARLDR
jgi:hypothetical protein